jgi:predicted acylesterase/phospholipase RssA
MRALVLSGGGANGAYEVGVIKALVSGAAWMTGHQPFEPDVLTGTSIGSFNAAYLVSRWEAEGAGAVESLERLWVERLATDNPSCGNGIYRYRADPFAALDPRCWMAEPFAMAGRLAADGAYLAWDGLQRFVHVLTPGDEPFEQRAVELLNLASFISRDPWERVLREEIDYAAIRRSPKQLRIAATNWATGNLKIYRNFEMTDQLGPRAILGSSSIPGFFTPAEVGSLPFVDGGVLLNTPLKPAIEAGATVFHMAYLDPEISNIPLSHLNNTVDALFRTQQIQWAAAVNDDIEDAESINKGLALLEDAERLERLDGDGRAFLRVIHQIRERIEGGRSYRPLTIFRYHPRDDLGGTLGFLDMRRERIVELIERGYQDALHHDCDESEDVLPGPEKRRLADIARRRQETA